MFGIMLSIILGIIFGIIFGTILGGNIIMKSGLAPEALIYLRSLGREGTLQKVRSGLIRGPNCSAKFGPWADIRKKFIAFGGLHLQKHRNL